MVPETIDIIIISVVFAGMSEVPARISANSAASRVDIVRIIAKIMSGFADSAGSFIAVTGIGTVIATIRRETRAILLLLRKAQCCQE